MSQIFNLRLAPETLVSDAQLLGVTIEELQRISITVSVSIAQQPERHLRLTYRLKLPNQSLVQHLDWPKWQQAKVGFRDYLWQQTCLECFIAHKLTDTTDSPESDAAAAYIEINASPDGRYALYQFDRYRYPSTLPPIPLLKTDGHTRAHIYWTDTNNTFDEYERSFSVPLTQLSSLDVSINTTTIEQINPCVILCFGDRALYFAPKHASPPDFHNRRYWSVFDSNTARAK